jgi:hypothetical protein
MIHARDRTTPENNSKDPGTFFSQIDDTVPLSDRTTRPMTIKITAVIVNNTNTLVDSIF